jgi:hypothetical protein
MSCELLQRRSISIPLASETFEVCILHRGRWHVTRVTKPFEDVVQMAEDAYRRSGLPVQVRDDQATILFEASTESAEDRHAGKETRTW